MPNFPPHLTVAEQHDLILKWGGLPLWTWKKFYSQHPVAKRMSVEEINSAGTLGLCKAARKFDPSKGCQFNTYAVWWVRQSIAECMYAVLPVRPPSHILEKLDSITDDRRKCVTQCLVRTYRVEGHYDGEDFPFLADDAHAIPWEDRETLREAIAQLPERLREIVRMRFWEGKSLEECGYRVGVTKERCRQLQEQAVYLLQKRFGLEVEKPKQCGYRRKHPKRTCRNCYRRMAHNNLGRECQRCVERKVAV
jgi:RNA polymerase sigma factor (sigma-70 family)